jgi:hypothetical protein
MDILEKKQKHPSLAIFSTSLGAVTLMRVNNHENPGAEIVIESTFEIPSTSIKKFLFEAGQPYDAIIILHRASNQLKHVVRLAASSEIDHANH